MQRDAGIPDQPLRQGGWRQKRAVSRTRKICSATKLRGWRLIRNTEIEVAFKAGTRYGLVSVLGCKRQARSGFAIGGPESAGAANLWAAWCKEKAMSSVPTWIRNEVETKTLRVRWQDDIVNIVDKSISRGAWKCVKKMRTRNFYGRGLDLNEEEGEQCAFGYEWRTKTGVVQVRSVNQYEDEFNHGPTRKKELPTVQGICEFGNQRRKIGTAVGRLVRVVDMTNEGESEVQRQLLRVMCELKKQGYTARMINAARRRAEQGAWVNMAPLRGAQQTWDKEEHAEQR